MNRWSNYFKALLLVMTTVFFSSHAFAQCSIKVLTGNEGCAPATSQFLFLNGSGKTVKTANWDFGDASGGDTNSVVTHIYNKRGGPYTVTVTVTFTDGTTCTATLPDKMHIYGTPTAGIILPSGPGNEKIQCLVNAGVKNKFCFTDNSTPGPDGWPLTKVVWNFGDGDTLEAPIGSSDENPCHSYKSEGTYNISITVYDSKGCKGFITQKFAIVVLKEIHTSYQIVGNPGCDSSTFVFKNTTDTTNGFVRHFEWDFGDGSPVDSTDFAAKHTYGRHLPGIKDTGTFTVTLTIVNKLGCKAVFVNTVRNVPFLWNLKFKDTVCWAGTLIGDATRTNPINFSQLNEANIDFMSFNFGDPASGTQNVKIFVNPPFSISHQFVGGPGPYNVHIHMHNSACNKAKDTCVTVFILGPQAQINLPPPPAFPPNNFTPPTPIPTADFLAINNSTLCTDTIHYVTFQKSSHVDTIFNFCGAKRLFLTGEDSDLTCKGTALDVFYSGVRLKPNSYKTVTVADSLPIGHTWKKNTAIPSPAYYPASGALVYNNMNDSDFSNCKMPDLVRFTNNSVKYRLKRALDDNTYTNVKNPLNSLRDTCTWHNYPFASDSLIYFWKFNDPNGKSCTSTVAKRDWYCKFSTEVAPYHFFSGLKPPTGGCQAVQLTVKDTVTKCQDSTTIQIKQGPPQAYWDMSVNGYCKMTWDLENVGIFAAKGHETGVPGLRGFNLKGPVSCASPNIRFLIDFSETLPSCGAQHYWMVFDSAQDRKVLKCANDPTKTYVDYGFFGNPDGSPRTNDSGWVSGAPDGLWKGFPFFGNYWYQENDEGCKTIGVMLQSGKCIETAWYHDFICFERLDGEFHVEQISRDSVLVGGQYKKTWDANSLGNSTNGFSPICNAFGAKPGISITVRPRTSFLKRVNYFSYTIDRRPFGDGWYYAKPFWPDTANVSASCHVTGPNEVYDTSWSAQSPAFDTIKTVRFLYYLPQDSSIYSDLKNRAGVVYGKAMLNNFPLRDFEINSLNSSGQVRISSKDQRARRLAGYCDDTAVTIKALTLPITSKATVPELDLASKGAIDTFFLPYPGFYSVNSFVTNMDGCYQFRRYDLIYGHFAEFWINGKNGNPGDSIICLHDTVSFSSLIRYWSVNCPPPAGGGAPPEGCTDGAIGGYVDPGTGNPYDVFHPWDVVDPIQLRKALLPSWNNQDLITSKRQEKTYWNFGDNGVFFGPTNGKPVAYTWKNPGVYTVTMRTIDSTGCVVDTKRRNLIKVVGIKAQLDVTPLHDTLTYCAPKSIAFANNSRILGGTIQVPHKRAFAYTEWHVSKDCKRLQLDTVIVDSLKKFTWFPGDGTSFGRPDTININLDFTKNKSFTVALQAETNFAKCKDIDIEVGRVTLIGPEPKFLLTSKKAQCYPYYAEVKNLNASKTGHAETIQYNVLDSATDSLMFTVKPQTVFDSITRFKLPYKRGTYRIQIVETDTFTDKFQDSAHQAEHCSATYPSDDSAQIYFTVYPHDTEIISGDSLVCAGATNTWKSSGIYKGQYDTYEWNFGDGTGVVTVADSFSSHAYADTGNYIIKVKASNSKTTCATSTTFKVKVEKLVMKFSTDSAASQVAKFTFHNHSKNGVKYIWDFGDSHGDSSKMVTTLDTNKAIFHEYTDLGPFTPEDTNKAANMKTFKVKLYGVSKSGCVDSIIKEVSIYRLFKHYNVFTPNGDGQNDKFVPGIHGETSYSLVIYDRWGNKVYESNDSKANWDGKDMKNNQNCPSGTYYYVWKFHLIGNVDKTINGTVTLLRD